MEKEQDGNKRYPKNRRQENKEEELEGNKDKPRRRVFRTF